MRIANDKLLAEGDLLKREILELKESGRRRDSGDEADLAKAQDEIEVLGRKLTARHEHVAKIAPQLSQAHKDLEGARADLDTARRDREAANAELAELRSSRANSDVELGRLRSELEQLRIKNESASAKVASAEGARDGLAATVEGQRARIEETGKVIANLQQELERARSDLEKAQVDARSVETGTRRAAELEGTLAARDEQLGALQMQLAEVKDEVKLEEEVREESAVSLKELTTQTDKLKEENAELHARLEEIEDVIVEKTEEVANALAEKIAGLERENKEFAERNEEIGAKRDDMTKGLEEAVEELEQLRQALAEHEVTEHTLREDLKIRDQELALSGQDLSRLREEAGGAKETSDLLAGAQRERNEARADAVRIGGELKRAEESHGDAQNELHEMQARLEKATEVRHESEMALVEARTKLESQEALRTEQEKRVAQLEEDLKRARDTRVRRGPAQAVEELASAIGGERKHFEKEQARWRERHDGDREELERLRRQLAEMELHEAELSEQLEGTQGARLDAMRAKAASGRQRSQIERMQRDVERARSQAGEAEKFWKAEMKSLEENLRNHLVAAENNEPGADARLVRVLEEVKVGVFDRHARLRKKHNKLKRESAEISDRMEALERILAKKELEEARMRKAVAELESAGKVPARKTPARKKAAIKKAPAKKKPAAKKAAAKKKK